MQGVVKLMENFMITFIIFASLSMISGFTDECNTVTESVFIEGSDGWTGSFGSINVNNGCAKVLPAPNATYRYRSLHFIAPVQCIFF